MPSASQEEDPMLQGSLWNVRGPRDPTGFEGPPCAVRIDHLHLWWGCFVQKWENIVPGAPVTTFSRFFLDFNVLMSELL